MRNILILLLIVIVFVSCKNKTAQEQVSAPTITVKFSNPVIVGSTYTVDVFAQSNIPDEEISGFNVRFFYDAAMFSNIVKFKDFQGGYGLHSLGQPKVYVGLPSTKTMFGFQSAMTFVNGGVQLTKPSAPKILLHPEQWNKIFSIELTLKGSNENVCASLVWDRLNDGESFLQGSEGIVIVTAKKQYAIEREQDLNWEQTGFIKFQYPYGKPLPCK